MSRLYLYAIVERAAAAAGVGLAGEPLSPISAGGVVAVVGEMEEAPAATPDAMRGHDAVVRRLAEVSDAILPARFGTVRDTPGLADWLAGAAAGLADALRLVSGREQMTVHVYRLEMGGPATAPDVSSEGRDAPLGLSRSQSSSRPGEPGALLDDAAGLGPGARYLAERRRHWRGQDRLPELEPLRPRLDALVAAERVELRGTPPLRASVYHLIARGRSAEYRDAIEANLGLVAGVRLRVSGPWAPYAFAPVVV